MGMQCPTVIEGKLSGDEARSGIGNRESGIGNRESGIAQRSVMPPSVSRQCAVTPVLLSSCPPVLLSSCPPVRLSARPPVLPSSCPPVLLSSRPPLLHIFLVHMSPALPTRADALALMHEYTPSESLRKHMLAVEAGMRAYAAKFGEDPDRWGLAGLIHDFDYERY